MKSSLFSKLITLMTTMLLSAGAFAAAGAAHKGTMEVSGPIMVNGKQLPPGTYTIRWDGDGPDTNLHVMQGKKEVAAAPCKVVFLDQKASRDEAETTKDSEGTQLTAVRFAGQKYELDLTGTTGQGQGKVRSVR
jgi:hypothetical protein